MNLTNSYLNKTITQITQNNSIHKRSKVTRTWNNLKKDIVNEKRRSKNKLPFKMWTVALAF